MTSLTLTKHHGLGNDFLVVFDPPAVDLVALARRVCDRRRGIGADGLLVATSAEGYTARMVLYNADGSIAEMSGNGIRCFVQAVTHGVPGVYSVSTDAGERVVELMSTSEPSTVMASVSMGMVAEGKPSPNWDAVGCHPDRPVAHLNLGNPHTVVGVDGLKIEPLDPSLSGVDALGNRVAFRPVRVGMIIAGFEVPHTHLHVVPMDGVHDLDFDNAARDPDPAALDAAADAIRTALRARGVRTGDPSRDLPRDSRRDPGTGQPATSRRRVYGRRSQRVDHLFDDVVRASRASARPRGSRS